MTTFLMIVAGLLGVGMTWFLLVGVFDAIKHSRLIKTFPNYYRELNEREIRYLETASAKLWERIEALEKNPWTYSAIYYAFIGLVILMWGGLFLLGRYLYDRQSDAIRQAEGLRHELGDIIWFETYPLGISWLLGGILGLVLAVWVMYRLTQWMGSFSQWAALFRSGATHLGPDEAMMNNVIKLEHEVRTQKLDVYALFDVDAFIDGQAHKNSQIAGVLTLTLLFVTALFLFLDINNRPIFFEQGLTYPRYWQGDRVEIHYDALDAVELKCKLKRQGRPETALHILAGSDRVASLNMTRKTVFEAWRLDNFLRTTNVEFRPFPTPPEATVPSYSQGCFQRLEVREHTDVYRMYEKVLHRQELIGG